MSDAPEKKSLLPLFLLAQQLRRLTATDPKHIRALVCRTERLPGLEDERDDPSKHWEPIARNAVIDRAASAEPGSRCGLVCDAGLGKTFNMRWLFAKLCDEKFRPRLPFLLRFDHAHDLDLLERAHDDPESLLDYLTTEVSRHDKKKHSRERIAEALRRKRENGQLILLFDGLDHALASKHFPTKLAKFLGPGQWEHCPLWVAGRPYAFHEAWDEVFCRPQDKWQYFQVDRFGEREIRQYMDERGIGDYFDSLPVGSRGLLGVPRLLKLVCDIIQAAIKAETARRAAEVVKSLKLNTPADVYHKAYFEPGRGDDKDTMGLIAQGIKDLAEKVGLRDGQPARPINLRDRIRRVGVLLGATAFHLFAQNSDAEMPEPNTSGSDLCDIREGLVGRCDAVGRLPAAGQGGVGEFDRDYDYLRSMNTHAVDFLLFAEASVERLRFQDRTAQAFFAAHWAMTFGTDEDRRDMRHWITDKKGKALQGFDEFWQFAAEMPDKLIDPAKNPEENRWHKTFASCYAAPQNIAGEHEWVQWHRRMLYHSFPAMEKRFPDTITQWREPFTRLASPSEPGHHIWREIKEGFHPIPAGTCHFGADPLEDPPAPGTPIKVAACRLHRYPVTNEMYELFDPMHQKNRWMVTLHPLAKKKPGGDDLCPVVNVTWYDAWAFAAWCECGLPTEEQWEHAARAGTAHRFSFGDDEAELPDHAWFEENSERMTHPVGGRPIPEKPHPHGLSDMHGNVWEWCDSWDDSEQMSRVLRGGSLIDDAWYCRAANRFRSRPWFWNFNVGFRLCLPGSA